MAKKGDDLPDLEAVRKEVDGPFDERMARRIDIGPEFEKARAAADGLRPEKLSEPKPLGTAPTLDKSRLPKFRPYTEQEIRGPTMVKGPTLTIDKNDVYHKS